MSCPAPERIAAAVAGEDRDAAAHALGCPTCRARFDDQREIRRLVGTLSRSTLSAAERERLGAGLMAKLEAPAPRRPFARIAVYGCMAAAVLALVLWAAGRDHGARDRSAADRAPVVQSTPPAPAATSGPRAPSEVAPPVIQPPVAPAPPAPVPRRSAIATARLSGAGARYGRATRGGHEVIDLHDGAITVDTRSTAPAEIQLGTTAIRVANAKVTVTARTGVLASVAVFAGSVEVSSAARSTIVTAGTVWEAPAELPTGPAASLTAFREGWIALRQNRLAAAIAAFDRATDPVVEEDAAYWAAVAIFRAGNRPEARRRFLAFVSRFPNSPRVLAARRAIENETPELPALPGEASDPAPQR